MFKKNVCKGCGESGYFLKLNKELLCPKCVELEMKTMSTDEVIDELVEWYKGSGTTKNIEAYLHAAESKNRREQYNFNKIFSRYKQARNIEKEGKLDGALSIYLQLLENCPPGTDYYIRPCIILEKKKEFTKAIEICDFAIENIRQGRFNADENEFLKRKERLVKKRNKQ